MRNRKMNKKIDKAALYESIMKKVAVEVRAALLEAAKEEEKKKSSKKNDDKVDECDGKDCKCKNGKCKDVKECNCKDGKCKDKAVKECDKKKVDECGDEKPWEKFAKKRKKVNESRYNKFRRPTKINEDIDWEDEDEFEDPIDDEEMPNERYTLVGVDGNAYAVMGYVMKGMRECGFSRQEIDAYLNDAKSSDYNHLLVVSMEMCDKLNNR